MTFVLAVGGISGAGKTHFSNRLISCLSPLKSALLSQDQFYLGGGVSTNYDIPSAVDFSRMCQSVQDLTSNLPTTAPIYDFKSHTRIGAKKISPAHVVIVEGTMVLTSPELRKLVSFSVFLRCRPVTAKERRRKRDLLERGRSYAATNSQYARSVEAGQCLFVEPSEKFAELVFDANNFEDMRKKTIDLSNRIKDACCPF